ncbi:MAG: hypothetical protein JRN52_14240 [Nitrososphaerota archaeon]|nr:hypothetical protein [Nitrososphaerota archaeon]
MAGNSGRHILSNRNFLDYFAMNVTSRTGGAVASVAVIWFVFAVTQSALDVTIVDVAQAVSTVAITLPSGVWVESRPN